MQRLLLMVSLVWASAHGAVATDLASFKQKFTSSLPSFEAKWATAKTLEPMKEPTGAIIDENECYQLSHRIQKNYRNNPFANSYQAIFGTYGGAMPPVSRWTQSRISPPPAWRKRGGGAAIGFGNYCSTGYVYSYARVDLTTPFGRKAAHAFIQRSPEGKWSELSLFDEDYRYLYFHTAMSGDNAGFNVAAMDANGDLFLRSRWDGDEIQTFIAGDGSIPRVTRHVTTARDKSLVHFHHLIIPDKKDWLNFEIVPPHSLFASYYSYWNDERGTSHDLPRYYSYLSTQVEEGKEICSQGFFREVTKVTRVPWNGTAACEIPAIVPFNE